MKRLLEIATLGLVGLCASAHGQEAPAPASTDVSPLVVTATRIPTPADQVGSSVSLITAQAIEDNQWRTLPDALADQPGLNVVQTGGPGGLTSVFIRGANANQSKVILDGIEVNDPSKNDAFDFGQVLTADLQGVEVLRGPQSSLYGADALGGVISLTTKGGEGPAHLTATLEGGSYDTFNQTLGLAGSTGALHYSLSLAHYLSGDTPITPLGLLAPGEARIGDYYNNLTASTKLGFDVSHALPLGLVLRYVGATLRNTGENYDLYPAPDQPDSAQTVQDTSQVFVRGEARLNLDHDRIQNLFGVGYANYWTHIQAPDDGFGLPAAVIDRSNRVNADWQSIIALSPRNTLVVGASDDLQQLLGSPVDAQETTFGGFAELQTRPIDPLTVAASIRYDNGDLYGDYTTWRIAPAFTVPTLGTLLKGSVGAGFKAPTLSELFVSYPAFDFFANPNLKPETSLGYDIGFEQPLISNRLRFGATWFHNDIHDLIETDDTGTTYANVGRATTYGVESFIALTPVHGLNIRADYTWLAANNDITGGKLLRQPGDKASLAATWRRGRLTLAGTLLYVGATLDGNRDFSRTLMSSPYATVNIAGAYDLGHGVTVFARVDNLLNRQYESPPGFDKPGIGAFGGVRLNLAGLGF
jgi:vitamin B12 transporter